MHASTESLLSYRDNEPLPAVERQHIESCASCQATLRSMKTLQLSLQQLPGAEPPAELQLGTTGFNPSAQARPWSNWIGGVAASLLVAVGMVFLLQDRPGFRGHETNTDTPVASNLLSETSPQGDASSSAEPPSDQSQLERSSLALRQLVMQSNRLEDTLRGLPAPPALATARVASTEATLVSQLELIDYGLSQAGTELSAEQQQRLWRGRVALMDSLVNLRYAQIHRASL